MGLALGKRRHEGQFDPFAFLAFFFPFCRKKK